MIIGTVAWNSAEDRSGWQDGKDILLRCWSLPNPWASAAKKSQLRPWTSVSGLTRREIGWCHWEKAMIVGSICSVSKNAWAQRGKCEMIADTDANGIKRTENPEVATKGLRWISIECCKQGQKLWSRLMTTKQFRTPTKEVLYIFGPNITWSNAETRQKWKLVGKVSLYLFAPKRQFCGLSYRLSR